MQKIKSICKKACMLSMVWMLAIAGASPAAAQFETKAVVKKETINSVDEKETEAENLTEAVEADAIAEEAEIAEEALYSPEDLQFMGVIHHDGYRYTWYSEKVLPGPGLNIPGRHVDENGYVCDEDDFICLASRDFSKGTELDTPFGKKGKIYDWCAISGTLDVYVSW